MIWYEYELSRGENIMNIDDRLWMWILGDENIMNINDLRWMRAITRLEYYEYQWPGMNAGY